MVPSMWTMGLKPHELIIHVLLLGVPASIVSKFYQRGVLFSYHPSAMGVAYLAVMGEGIMLAKAAAGKTKMATLALHLWTQAAASLIALAGFYAIYKNKKNNGAKHFTSMHGKLGGLTVLGTVGISVGGLISFYGTKLLPKSLWGSLEAIKSLHRNGGEWVWFMAMMCIYLGIQPNNLDREWNKSQLKWGWVAGMLIGSYMVFNAPSARGMLAAKMASMAANS